MRTVGIAGAVVAAMVVATASADAATLRLKGQVVGQPKSKVQLDVQKNGHGNLTAISTIGFTNVAMTCSDGSGGAISGSDPRSFSITGKSFTRKTRVLGTGIDHGYFRATGKFRRGGKAVKGKVRFALTTTAGPGCGTGSVAWRAAT